MADDPEFLQFQEAALAAGPRVACVLGSGLGAIAERLAEARELPFGKIPGLASEATVVGHRGSLLLGRWAGQPVLMFAGRLHYYEGHPWERVVRPVQLAHELGARILVVTNAAGGIRPELAAGSLLVLSGHLDCTGPLRQAPPLVAHDPKLVALVQEAGRRCGLSLASGLYAQVTGPSYETRAEVRALRACGADAVGMSTGREIQAATALGMACAALSCITNCAAGLAEGPISHDEVLATNALQQDKLGDLLEAFLMLQKP